MRNLFYTEPEQKGDTFDQMTTSERPGRGLFSLGEF